MLEFRFVASNIVFPFVNVTAFFSKYIDLSKRKESLMLLIIESECGTGEHLRSAVQTAEMQERYHSLASAGRPGLSCLTHYRGECRSVALEPVCALESPGGGLTRCPTPRDSDSIGLGVAWALGFVKDPGVTLMAGIRGGWGAPLPQRNLRCP